MLNPLNGITIFKWWYLEYFEDEILDTGKLASKQLEDFRKNVYNAFYKKIKNKKITTDL